MKNEQSIQPMYVGIVVVLIVVLAGGYLYFKRSAYSQQPLLTSVNADTLPPAGPNAKGKGQIVMGKGTILKDSPLFPYAYQIVPGELSEPAKKAMIGFTMNTQNQSDGSIVVTLMPKDAEDQKQTYTVQPGQTLYFIEQTLGDDIADQDKDLNYKDDYGIIVDINGIIQ